LLALEETDLPYHVSTVGLETVGQYTFTGKLDHPMAAHPKICPVTGELFLFGHEVSPDPTRAFVSYSVVSKKGELLSTVRIPVRGPRFMHDMGLTEHFAIFLDLPALFDFELKEGTPWAFDPSIPLRFGVFPRYSKDPSAVKWFDCQPGMIFHTINAYETPAGHIVMQCCRAERYAMDFNRTDDAQNWLFPYEWVLDLKSGTCVREARICPIRCDFPLVAPSVVSRKHRFSYYSTYRPRPGDNAPLYDGLVKLDHLTGRAVEIKLESHLSCAEFSFVPRPNATAEDDGYLITHLYNDRTKQSELAIYDARTVESGDGSRGCVCRIGLPQRVPYGFHGNWIARRDLESAINC
jgi:carotenoid cleavage dioxygenase-like enzyme